MEERKRAAEATLARHEELGDLLAIPQLMDTCVRRELFDEALDLAEVARRLALANPGSRTAVALAAEAEGSCTMMHRQLLASLQTGLALPKALQIVGLLRRVARLSEPEVRVRFLLCRTVWLESSLAKVPADAHDRIVDAHRAHLFEIVTQYRAIFADEAGGAQAGLILGTWAAERVRVVVAVIRAMLPSLTSAAALSSLLEQCMYCGSSLARVGLDFRALLPALFEAKVMDMLRGHLQAAQAEAERALATYHPAAAAATSSAKLDPQAAAGADQPAAAAAGLTPPVALAHHAPLAVWTNGYLTALNELRLCCPVAVEKEVHQIVQKAFAALQSTIKTEDHLTALAEQKLKPFVNVSLDAIFGRAV